MVAAVESPPEIEDLIDSSDFVVRQGAAPAEAEAVTITLGPEAPRIDTLPVARYVRTRKSPPEQRTIALVLTVTLAALLVGGLIGVVWFDAPPEGISQLTSPLATLVAAVVTFYFTRGGNSG